MPLQHVAVAAYGDEAHVEENRRLYRIKFDLADQIIGNRYGYRRPAGGFCLWLDVSAQGGDEAATVQAVRDGGVRVVPGSYLARAAGRRLQSRRGLHPRRAWCRTVKQRPRRCTAWSAFWISRRAP